MDANTFELPAERSVDIPIALPLERQPLFLWRRWYGGLCLDLIVLGVRFLVVGFAGVVLALAGILLSVLSVIGHLFPCPSDALSGRRRSLVQRNTSRGRRTRRQQQSEPNHLAVVRVQRSMSSPPALSYGSAHVHQSTSSIHVRFVETHTVYSYIQVSRASSTEPPNSPVSPAVGRAQLLREPGPVTSSGRIPGKHRPSPLRQLDGSLKADARRAYISPQRTENARIKRRPKPMRLFSLPRGGVKLRECFSRTKQPNVAPRTDPYQAPYFFPSPGSAKAARYVQEVQTTRRSGATSSSGTTFKQRYMPARRWTFPPHAKQSSVPEADVDGGVSSAKKSRRWSWHFPMAPRTPRSSTTSARSGFEMQSDDVALGHPTLSLGKARAAVKAADVPDLPLPQSAPATIVLTEDVQELRLSNMRPSNANEPVSVPGSTTRRLSWRERFRHRRSASVPDSGTPAAAVVHALPRKSL
ncbi:hypothetical protein WOLCODRAFT_135467 [Wolfiporia cocos MD-104 SS10]|uniref:Uncharacterized protein n=1 Tax=Wolfiporia cocos (strain MD-104) TaxID=742152 RepID=A0A2H3JDK0_WOLCO|nr:hypothetical protein WOLCODRAFT_135467 [Wolfiporia cocos MD-104 SS10]